MRLQTSLQSRSVFQERFGACEMCSSWNGFCPRNFAFERAGAHGATPHFASNGQGHMEPSSGRRLRE